ncbi:MAG: type I-E CRISPR-associated protein Cse2/CasB [Bacteroidota bacterium]
MSDATSTSEPKAQEAAFADRLYGLSKRAKKDGSARATLARLRRTISRRGVDPMAYREVGAMLPRDLSERERETYLLVAALYAIHAAKSEAPWYGGYVGTEDGFGVSCGKLRGNSGSMDLRFSALLDARREDLPYRLRQAISLLAASGNDIGVRYDRLLDDLLSWDAPRRPVQRRWAADYWT